MIRGAALVVAIVVVASVAARGDAAKKPDALHFSHKTHAGRLDTHRCEMCHSVDDAGAVKPPAALGHAPCMQAQCHASWFLATSEARKKTNPQLHARAAQFCAGCHESPDGAPPKTWTKPSTAAVMASFQAEREYHIEMPHFTHTKNGPCRDCHVVDDKFRLVANAPGHAQCVQCHNAKALPDHPMTKCMRCHNDGGRAETYGSLSRPKNDVRACGSEGQAQIQEELAKQRKKSDACYTHDRKEHRVHKTDGSAVQCGECHVLVTKNEYQDLKDLHSKPIIDPAEGVEHKACGQKGCHEDEVNNPMKNKCAMCHARKSTDTF